MTYRTPFTGLDEDMCDVAFGMVRPAIDWGISMGFLNKKAGCIIILDPLKPYWPGATINDMQVLYTKTINSAVEDAKYVEIATMKAFISWKHLLPSIMVQQQYPYMYDLGNTKWGGSTVLPGGLVIAFSGVQEVFDEMISEWTGSAIRGLSRWEMVRPDGIMKSDSSFIGID